MRIFYAAQSTPNEIGLPGSRLWQANLFEPLVDLGHEVVPFEHPWLADGYNQDLRLAEHRRRSDARRPGFSETLVRAVQEEHRRRPLQVFFSYLTSAHVTPDAIREIGHLGLTTINWYCNASYQFHNVEAVAPAFHACLVPEKFRLPDYRRVGARPLYCQEAANPKVYHPYEVPSEFDVTFVGQRYGSRPRFVHALRRAGIDARVWGPGWQTTPPNEPRWRGSLRHTRQWVGALAGRHLPPLPRQACGPTLSDEDLIRMYSRSRISLGFTSVAELPADGSPPIKQVRLRDFEATMSGAFYLVEHCEELAEFFEPDREIVFFHDEMELVDKAHYYLRHEAERERIRQAGLRRARAEHTWQRRFQDVFRELGLT